MPLKIDQDYARFKKIIRGKIKQDLKKFMTQGEMIGKKGKDYVSIPLPRITLPHFEHDYEKKGGVGQGEGEKGSAVGKGKGQPGDGAGSAGEDPGQHVLEVDVNLGELAEILGEELQLPRIMPKGIKQSLQTQKNKYTGISNTGPDSLRHFRRTYRQALVRQIVSGSYQSKDPMVIPIRHDMRFRSSKVTEQLTTSAVIIYIMDVSGSMGVEQKEIVRTTSFWIDTWIKSQFKDLQTRYIIHDAQAKLVYQETLYHTRESGGTIK